MFDYYKITTGITAIFTLVTGSILHFSWFNYFIITF